MDDCPSACSVEPAPAKSDVPPQTQTLPRTSSVEDDFVTRTLKASERLPALTVTNWHTQVVWFNLIVIVTTPAISLYGALTTKLSTATFAFCLFYYVFNMIGITAGYHRLWSHRSYNAHPVLQYLLALAGSGAVQGSIHWWARGHRTHHRYTDTDLDPYGAHHGLLWTHIGWMLFRTRVKHPSVDISDLKRNPIVLWQHRSYFTLVVIFGFILPSVIPGYFWGDWRGGFFFAAFARLTCVHHSTFCVNSLAHWLGETTFDDKHTPRDHLLTALLTLGEGYHNFHHQFPMDYRNAIKWYQYDPTKWFIRMCYEVGLASHLRVFPEGEIRKSELTMQLKRLKREQDSLEWPMKSEDLPVISWASFQEQAATRPLVLVSGFIHDVSIFMDDHPGGRHMVSSALGKDATTSFFGGVYEHSHAAHNLLATMRVGVLLGGLELICENATPPCQKLQIVEADVSK